MAVTQFKDYYAAMGVAPDATPDQIKAAWRTLARKFHPDINKAKDAQKRFTDIGEANDVLSDPVKRKAYDEVRRGGWREGQDYSAPDRHGDDGGNGGGNPFAGGRFSGADGEDFSDFFNSMFGARGGRRAAPVRERGEDLRHVLDVTLDEAYAGGSRELHLQLPPTADGSDTAAARTLQVKIPKGVVDGENIRLRGQGMPGATPEHNGNLYLEMRLKPHPFYRVDGRDILLDLPLTPWEAVLGAQVPAPTLGGPTTVTIPPGSHDGQRLRLRGRGLPGAAPEQAPGDQYLTLRLTVPPTASEPAQKLWRELAAASPYQPRRHLGV